MRRFDHSSIKEDPYPDGGTAIHGFRYESALVLLRLKDAVKLRTGEDADYLTGRPFVVSWRDPGGVWQQITVPAGLITDLTSVPRPFRWIVGRVGPWLEAAILHDYLYIAWQDVPGRGPRRPDRLFADRAMFAAMRAAKVGLFMSLLIYCAVRILGGPTYRGRNPARYIDLSDPLLAAQLASRAN